MGACLPAVQDNMEGFRIITTSSRVFVPARSDERNVLAVCPMGVGDRYTLAWSKGTCEGGCGWRLAVNDSLAPSLVPLGWWAPAQDNSQNMTFCAEMAPRGHLVACLQFIISAYVTYIHMMCIIGRHPSLMAGRQEEGGINQVCTTPLESRTCSWAPSHPPFLKQHAIAAGINHATKR